MITETKALFEAAVQGCPKDLLGKMYAIHNRYDALKARSDWPSISMEIYMKNKDALQQDEILSVKEWEQGVFFEVIQDQEPSGLTGSCTGSCPEKYCI